MGTRAEGQDSPAVTGETLLAADGSTWFMKESELVQVPPWDEGERASVLVPKAALNRLASDQRVWAGAWGLYGTVPPRIDDPQYRKVKTHGPDMRDTDPPEQWVEQVARASMSDSIAEVCDGARMGLEQQVTAQIRALIGDSEWGTANTMLAQLRMKDADEQFPLTVSAKVREPMQVLANLAGSLPVDSDARRTITQIAQSKVALPEAADKLFRQLLEAKVDTETAWAAHAAASAVASAY